MKCFSTYEYTLIILKIILEGVGTDGGLNYVSVLVSAFYSVQSGK